MPSDPTTSPVKHIFVLMLENRSLDHMLGFSKLEGYDAVDHNRRKLINGLTGDEYNLYNGKRYQVSKPAPATLKVDPPHDFNEVLQQLCGDGTLFRPNEGYPPRDNSGFAARFGRKGGEPGDVMKGFEPSQVPVLCDLARHFAICDNWRASLPGSTWPNRFFAHAATSRGLDHEPRFFDHAHWYTSGFAFKKGSIFDRLRENAIRWRIYRGGDYRFGRGLGWIPCVASIKGVHIWDTHSYANFKKDLDDPNLYPDDERTYTFIEPHYGKIVIGHFHGGNSQHPLDGVTGGEQLIKATYEDIRASRLWRQSLLIVTWDEHGGFYDHVRPTEEARTPDETDASSEHNDSKFKFNVYGPRVPAVVVSPWIKHNVIDSRLYDHASIPATVEKLFGNLAPLTERDKHANHLFELLQCDKPREDTPLTLPPPASLDVEPAPIDAPGERDDMPVDEGDHGGLPAFYFTARKIDHELASMDRSPPLSQNRNIRTVDDVIKYIEEVGERVDRMEQGRAEQGR